MGELCACYLTQWIMVLISLCYMDFVLKVDFGSRFGYVAFAALAGCVTGVSFGFMVVSIGQISESLTQGILMVSIMLGCFLSGLMLQNMRIYVERVCLWFNKVNPAALISDSFYSLSVYQSLDRYCMNLIILTVMSFIFSIIGFLAVRREKYAAL